MSALLPNPLLKGVYQYLNADDMDKSFGNAYMTAIAAAVNNGKAPGPDASPEEQQAFLDKIKQNVRSTFMLKGLLGLISPLAPQVHITDLTKNGTEFRDEFNALVDKSNYKDALAKFLDEHGSKAVSYTISHTKPTIDGSYFPYTQGMLDYLQSPISREIMNSPFATGGAFLVPQTEGPGDIQVIHSELMKMHLREQQTPADFLKAVYIAQGNADIRDDRNQHEANLAKFAGNSQATAAENQAWSDWVKGKAHANPIWYADYTSQDRTNIAVRAFQDLYDMYQYGGQTVITGGKKVVVPQLPDTQQTRLVMGLMADYAQHTRNLAKVKGTHSATVERQRWSDYLKQVEQQQPLLQTVITSVFSRLDGSNV
jgi:hypothetical protein